MILRKKSSFLRIVYMSHTNTHEHHHHHHDGHCSCGCGHDHHHGPTEHRDEAMESAQKQLVLYIAEMCCAVEGDQAVRALKALSEVSAVCYNTLNRTVTVGHALDDESVIFETLAKAGLAATVKNDEAGPRRVRWRVAELDCDVEAGEIRRALEAMTLKDLVIDPRLHVVSAVVDAKAADAVEMAIARLGYSPIRVIEAEKILEEAPNIPWMKLGIAGAFALVSEACHWFTWPEWLGIGCALVAIFLAGLSTYRRGLTALVHLNFNMNALMAVAVTGAVLIGHWPEAAMVMVLFEVSEAIEALSIDRAHRAIKSLLNLTPEKARRVYPDGQTEEVEVSEILVGERIRVAPGESIALDGVVVDGTSSVMQAAITGESIPVEKHVGEKVFGGTTNQTGELTIEVTSDASHGIAAKMIEAVEAANQKKAPMERFVDVFARYYTPGVFALALLTAILPPLFLAGDWFDWIYRGLVLLVIACPCALVISTPVTVVSGLAVAARLGLIIKGGVYLEEARRLKYVALDKTGTITQGKPEVIEARAYGLIDQKQMLVLAASLADRSTHPISQAISRYADRLEIDRFAVDAFKTTPGAGTQGRINGSFIRMVSPRAFTAMGELPAEIQKDVETYQAQGASVVLMADFFGVCGLIAVADRLREEAKGAIEALEQMGVTPVLITGDNQATARHMAELVGIKTVHAEMLPEDKLAVIESMQKDGLVAMVGDGINDAPALAQADIGMAMAAGGSEIAVDAANVALMDDDVAKIATLIKLSQMTHNRLVQNIVMALGVKFIFMVMTFMGMATMWMAVFADIGICLIVVAWGMALLGAEKTLRH